MGALQVIGYLERVAFIGWGVSEVTAKMDTGADTSALHVEQLQLLSPTRVAFGVHDELFPKELRRVQARILRRGWVRCSSGEEEERVFVRAAVRVGSRSRSVEVGLVDRSRMQYRLLLGRSALQGAYLVDPGRSYLANERCFR
jgi:hypothetical protein